MIKTGIGKSNNPDHFQAGREATQKAIDKSGAEKPDLLIVSASISINQEKALGGVNSVSPGVPVVGGSPGWGAITNAGLSDKEVAVAALKFEKIRIAVVSAGGMSEDSLKTGAQLGEKLIQAGGEPPKLALVFHSSFGGKTNTDDFAQGLHEKIGKYSSVVGGGTGDDMGTKLPGFQYHNNQLLTDSVVAAGLWGDFSFSFEAEHGWETIGLPAKVTKAQGNVIFEIDGKPAVNIYERYFGKSFQGLGEKAFPNLGYGYPLGILPERSGEKIILRQAMFTDKQGNLILAGSIPQGSKVSLIYANAKKMPAIAKKVTKGVLSRLEGGKPQVAFVWDCVCRKTLTVPDHQKEIDAIVEVLGKEVPLFGFYSYGEWGMGKGEEKWLASNETLVLILLKE